MRIVFFFWRLRLRIGGRRARWVVRADLGIVEDAEFDWIEAEFFSHLIHRNLQSHQSGSLAGSAHGVSFRQVEERQAHGGHPGCSGITLPRLADRWLGR